MWYLATLFSGILTLLSKFACLNLIFVSKLLPFPWKSLSVLMNRGCLSYTESVGSEVIGGAGEDGRATESHP